MKTLLIFSILTMNWCLAVDVTNPTGKAFSMKMPIIKFEQTHCTDALEFLRAKATLLLHEEMQIDTECVTFEYSFDPKMNDISAKVHSKIDYSGRNVSVAEVLTALLHQYGLTYEIVSPKKVIIMDMKPAKQKARQDGE